MQASLNVDESDVPVLSPDIFRHNPISVQLIGNDLGRYSGQELTSRHIRRNTVILEVEPPLEAGHAFSFRSSFELRFRLPYFDQMLQATATVVRVVQLGKDPDGKEISAIGVRLEDLDLSTQKILEAHDIRVRSELGYARSSRIPVRFPVEFSGLDVMSSLYVTDLSMTGMFVIGRAKFPAGKNLNVRFKLPFQKEELALIGKVVWTGNKRMSAQEEISEGFGIHFVDIPPAARAALAEYYVRYSFL